MKRFKFVLFFFLICNLAIAQKTTLYDQMQIIQNEYKIHFIYDSKINTNSIYKGERIKGLTLKEALTRIFRQTNISFLIAGNNVILKERKIPYYILSGYVKDNNGEPIVNATVRDIITGSHASTDAGGRYRIYLKEGEHTIVAYYFGNKSDETRIYMKSKKRTDFTINTESFELKEVVVNENNFSQQSEKTILTADDINKEFSLLSSPDVIKTLQSLPGISDGIELTSGLYVRGGNNDENLFILDGAPVYQTNHSLGLFSAFNTDIIKNIDFYKNGFPARYSGRLSSVADIRTRDGNTNKVCGSFSIGLLDGRLHIEGPIAKRRTSFNIALRRSWLDLPLKLVYALTKDKNDNVSYDYAFYDINAKVTHRFKDNSIWASLYTSHDKYGIKDDSSWDGYSNTTNNKMNWGNVNVCLGGDFNLSDRLFAQTKLIYAESKSVYRYDDDDTYRDDNDILHRNSLDIRSDKIKMQDFSVRADALWNISSKQKLRVGLSSTIHKFKPQEMTSSFYFYNTDNNIDTTAVCNGSKVKSIESVFYIESLTKPVEFIKLNIGSSLTIINVKGKTYYMFDPRLSANFIISKATSFNISATRMSQGIHRISSCFLDLPMDFWTPITEKFKPSLSYQLTAGLKSRIKNYLNIDITTFYKKTYNIFQFKNWNGINPSATDWEKNSTSGKGLSYGLETMIKFRKKDFCYTLAYTLSWSKRYFNELYKVWFPDQFDNRHKLNISLEYHPTKSFSVFTQWTLHSGNKTTVPTAYIPLPNLSTENTNNVYGFVYSKPNNYTLPVYHRLDCGCNFTRKGNKSGNEYIWNVSIYNLYCHLNTMYIKTYADKNGNIHIKPKGFIPTIPSVSYTIKF